MDRMERMLRSIRRNDAESKRKEIMFRKFPRGFGLTNPDARRILIFAGVFNPPHRHHMMMLHYVYHFLKEPLNLQCAIIMPAPDSYLREKYAGERETLILSEKQRIALWNTEYFTDGEEEMKSTGYGDWYVAMKWVSTSSGDAYQKIINRPHLPGENIEFVHLRGTNTMRSVMDSTQIYPDLGVPVHGIVVCNGFRATFFDTPDSQEPPHYIAGAVDWREVKLKDDEGRVSSTTRWIGPPPVVHTLLDEDLVIVRKIAYLETLAPFEAGENPFFGAAGRRDTTRAIRNSRGLGPVVWVTQKARRDGKPANDSVPIFYLPYTDFFDGMVCDKEAVSGKDIRRIIRETDPTQLYWRLRRRAISPTKLCRFAVDREAPSDEDSDSDIRP